MWCERLLSFSHDVGAVATRRQSRSFLFRELLHELWVIENLLDHGSLRSRLGVLACSPVGPVLVSSVALMSLFVLVLW